MDLIERMALANWGKEEYFPLCWQEGMTAVLDAIRETHAIVPREPTEAMLEAGTEYLRRVGCNPSDPEDAFDCYSAMIEAGGVKG